STTEVCNGLVTKSAPTSFAILDLYSDISLTTIKDAPDILDTANAIKPIGPAPAINTTLPLKSAAVVVNIALPKGSITDAYSKGILSSIFNKTTSGRTMNSEKTPFVSTPKILIL